MFPAAWQNLIALVSDISGLYRLLGRSKVINFHTL